MRVDAAGGTPVAATELQGGDTSHRWPCFLPDGKHFLYFARGPGGSNNAVYLGALGSNQRALVLRNDSNAVYAEPGYLLLVRNGTLMAQRFNPRKLAVEGDAMPIAEHVAVSGFYRGIFAASSNGVLLYQGGGTAAASQLIWFDRTGKQGAMVLPEAALYRTPGLSPDGSKLAVTILEPPDNADIWVIDLARGTKSRFTFGPAFNAFPVWWPDGKSIVFESRREGASQIYRKAADGTAREEKLLGMPGTELISSSISSDGRYLAYYFIDPKVNQQYDIWALPLFGDRKPFPLVNTPFNESQPSISPDGKWFAYTSNDTGRYEIYIKPFPGGEGKYQVSTSGAVTPLWRSDGRELYFLALGGMLMALEVREKGASLELGAPQELFQVNPVAATDGFYNVSADGKRFVINGTTAQAAEPFTLITNWPADLRK